MIQSGQHFVPRHIRKIEVQEHQIELFLACALEALRPSRGLQNAHVIACKLLADNVSEYFVVVDHQHSLALLFLDEAIQRVQEPAAIYWLGSEIVGAQRAGLCRVLECRDDDDWNASQLRRLLQLGEKSQLESSPIMTSSSTARG